MKKVRFIVSVFILSVSSAVALSQETSPNNAYTQSVTREVLVSGFPGNAEGQILELVRYTIAKGAKLPVHIHPGMQIERVEFGILTYTVVKGSATLKRANGTQEILSAGQTTQLNVGDSLVEPAGMVHFGENSTASPVILLSASLLDAKQPKAILINP
ncbi:cupin domain-containing protein [Gloeothece verrucosa]|uniref:Cupin 2 conserved barrel domain protein n=1 Tax=Gloeothece verrucosa (strain PCC 7822) TaxID=497965 RepID=E0U9A6_GLOV7|nr:cupin domain-containing protein [Gloeothece verrucosa]ADN17364.1 Cupin 2 conserved barrel domain protein [Gloeothece verrucosa PCC 7822]